MFNWIKGKKEEDKESIDESATIVNLTNKEITVMDSDRSILSILPVHEGTVHKCEQDTTLIGTIRNVPIKKVEYTTPLNEMPREIEGVYYVVSMISATALKNAGRYKDILTVGKTIRDRDKQIIGCYYLTKA